MEIWKKISDFENYEVSNQGRVRNTNRNNRILKGSNVNGYQRVGLYSSTSGKMKLAFIHRLVAEAFIPNPNYLPQVNHKDEDKQNNCIENLEWCSALDNINYGTRNQKVAEKLGHKIGQYNLNGKLINIFSSMTDANKQTGICLSSICQCVNGKRNHAGGYVWRRLNE